jgi:ADP-heptose:LPS heptosyltransferase
MSELVLVSPRQIGDTLLATPAIRAYKRAHPETRLTVCCADEGGAYQVLLHNPYVDELVVADPAGLPGPRCVLDPEVALEHGWSLAKPFAWAFGRMLGVDIDSVRYDYVVTPDERASAEVLLRELGEGKPVVIVARHSVSCMSNHPAVRRANKCVENMYWLGCAEKLMQRGYLPLAVGSREEADDPRYARWPGKRLYGHPLRIVAAMCAQCAGVLTVDNGIRHLAAAAGANVYALSSAIPLKVIACAPVREGQRIVEENILLRNVGARTLPRGAERLGL